MPNKLSEVRPKGDHLVLQPRSMDSPSGRRKCCRSGAVPERIALAAGLLAAVALCATGCTRNAPGAIKPPPPEVTVAKPVSREITDYFEFPGQTAAVGCVEVRARVLGHIIKVSFQDGQDVKKGDVLFEIDPRPYQAELDRAAGEVARAQAVEDKAKVDLARSDRLRPSGAVSVDEYEQRQAQMKIAKASIQTAEAALRDAKLNLEFTKIVSPIDGRVSRTRITEGNLAQPGTSESAVLTTVVTINPIYVYFSVDEDALLQYRELATRSGRGTDASRLKDQKIRVEMALGREEGYPHKGLLDFQDNQLDPKTGTLRVRGVFDNAKEDLAPGLFCSVRIPFGKPRRVLLVPESAIGMDQRLKVLLVVNKDNVVQSRRVKLGSLQDELRVIESGIGPEDRVIVNGLQRARPGMTVAPQEAKHDAATTEPKTPGKATPSDATRTPRN
ncbi:MAG: efflux RND transporter periplasmic adaptor subunit [Pirellulales bacterium]